MRARAFHIIPWCLAAVYLAWSIYILIFGGDWGPIFLYYPLWPFSIGLESLINILAEEPNEYLNALVCGIWIIGGMVWYLLIGYLISWLVIRISRLFRHT
jgi:hypothetical protein